jgi:hypothetical protein
MSRLSTYLAALVGAIYGWFIVNAVFFATQDGTQ